MTNIIKQQQLQTPNLQNDSGVSPIRKPQAIFEEIQELESHKWYLKRCMNDFNITHRFPECLGIIQRNFQATKNSIIELRTELLAVKAHLVRLTRFDNAEHSTAVKYNASELEQKAMAAFYNANR